MRQFEESTDYWVKVKAKFLIDSNGAIDDPKSYHAVLYDKNPLTTNRIAAEYLKHDGSVIFEFPLLASIRNKETPAESKPDLYIELYRKEELVYTTKVHHNVDFFIHNDHKRQLIKNTVDLGKFRVRVRQTEPAKQKAT